MHYMNGAKIVTTRDTATVYRDGWPVRYSRAEVERNTTARAADRGFWTAVLAWMDGSE